MKGRLENRHTVVPYLKLRAGEQFFSAFRLLSSSFQSHLISSSVEPAGAYVDVQQIKTECKKWCPLMNVRQDRPNFHWWTFIGVKFDDTRGPCSISCTCFEIRSTLCTLNMVKGVQLKPNLTKKNWINKDADGMDYGMETGLVVIAQFPCKLKFSHRNIWRFRQSEYIYYTNQLQKFHRRYAFTHWKKVSFQKHKTADQVIKHTSQSAIQLTDISTWKHQSEFHYVHQIPHIQKRNACLFFLHLHDKYHV